MPFFIENDQLWQFVIDQEEGFEFDWLGIDKSGQMATFSRYMTGYTPACVTKSRILFNDLGDFIEALEEKSGIITVTNKTGNYHDWDWYTQRGIWTYYNEDNYLNRYYLIHKPTRPINCETISGFKKFESIIPVFNIDFKEFITFDELKEALV